jgi:hypothetical protein
MVRVRQTSSLSPLSIIHRQRSTLMIHDFEDEFKMEAEAVRRELQSLRAGLPASMKGVPKSEPVDRPAANRAIAARLRAMKDVLANLAVEIAQAPADVRTEAQGRLAGYKASMGALEKEAATVKKLCADADNTREDGSANSQTRHIVEASRATMEASSARLREAERTMQETNAMADATLEQLQLQRETIRHTREVTHVAYEELSTVQLLLRNMRRKLWW